MDAEIYLDWAATAPLSQAASEAMLPLLSPGIEGIQQGNGNANELYSAGRDAFKKLEAARKSIAQVIDARPDELIFTSGATEANNAALFGIMDGLIKRDKQRGRKGVNPVFITSEVEHDSILSCIQELKARGVTTCLLPVSRSGHVAPDRLENLLGDLSLKSKAPILVSLMALNNETGAVMDVNAFARIAHRFGALFHCDATQALGKLALSVKAWGVDALSLSSHKVGGPKGMGALFLKTRTPFTPLIFGGGQESGKRSGTQNIVGAVGFSAALEKVEAKREERFGHLMNLRDYLYVQAAKIPGVQPTQPVEAGSHKYGPHIVSLLCKGFESETLIMRFNQAGICVAGGSACSSRDLEPSHVLKAMGISRDLALGSLRISMGPTTTREEIESFLRVLSTIMEEQQGL